MASVHRVAYRLTNHDAGWTSNGATKCLQIRPYETL
jgi:hypothetical protein